MDPRQVRAELDRILRSPGFAHSDRMARFLRLVVERALDGSTEQVKEYLLGVEVFDRRPDYDPRVDPIVRVEARRLRSKLEEFYENNGHAAEIIIELPKGGYVPCFRQPGAAAPTPAVRDRSRSVAVLPISNSSRDHEYDYLCEGITQEVIHALTKASGLRVVAWQSAARIHPGEQDMTAVGRQLDVAYVLKGTLRASARRIRLLAQLIDTSNNEYVWSESYDRQITDIFDIEQDISAAIVRALQTQIFVCRRPTLNPEVYSLYLKGRYHWNKRTIEGLRHSVDLFQQALQLEPDFALGHAGLADAYILLTDYSADAPSNVVGCARSSARRALALDPTLGEAEATLGLISAIHDWEWDKAEQHLRRSLELNPSYVTAHLWLGLDYLALRGRFDEARHEIDIAVQLDPLSSILRESVGYVELLARNYDRAETAFLDLIEFDPMFYKGWTGLGRTYYFQHRYDQALEALFKGRSLAGDVPPLLCALAQTYAASGQTAKATDLYNEILKASETRYVSSASLALVQLGFGDEAAALAYLDKAYRQRETPLASAGVHPLWDPLRKHPAFIELLGKIGLQDLL